MQGSFRVWIDASPVVSVSVARLVVGPRIGVRVAVAGSSIATVAVAEGQKSIQSENGL